LSLKFKCNINDICVRGFVLTGAPLSLDEDVAMKRLPMIFSLLAALTAAGPTAQSQDPVLHGRALLAEFCGRCHAIRSVGKSRHPGAPPFRMLGRSFDLDQFPLLLERGISAGHPDMPEIKFSVDDANAVVAYLRTIQQ
jgi:cytochrome c